MKLQLLSIPRSKNPSSELENKQKQWNRHPPQFNQLYHWDSSSFDFDDTFVLWAEGVSEERRGGCQWLFRKPRPPLILHQGVVAGGERERPLLSFWCPSRFFFYLLAGLASCYW